MRRSNWPTMLEQGIKSNLETKFSRGEFDCFVAAFDLIRGCVGFDPIKKYRGKYKTLKKAQALMKSEGAKDFESVIEIICVENKFIEVPTGLGQRGDLVLIKQTTGQAVGVISLNGYEVLFADAEKEYGYRSFPLTNAMRVWRVE